MVGWVKRLSPRYLGTGVFVVLFSFVLLVMLVDLDALALVGDHVCNGRGQQPSPPQPPRVALCISGQLRTFDMDPRHPKHPQAWEPMTSDLPVPNMTVAQSWHRNLFPKLRAFDLFMNVASSGGPKEPAWGNQSACEPIKNAWGGRLSCKIVPEEPLPLTNAPWWKQYYYREPKYHQGLLQQLYGMYRCFQDIKQSSETYDWVVRMRPDAYVDHFPELSELGHVSNRTVFYATKTRCRGGNEDWFGIMPYTVAEAYFERFLIVQQVPWRRQGATRRKWTAEMFLMELMKKKGFQLKAHPEIRVCLVKPTDRKHPGDT